MFNFREAEIFRAVMQEGSISRAADRLGVSQPAASKYIGLLERRLGTPLFSRSGRRLVPTPESYALLEEVERLLTTVGQVENFMKSMAGGKRGNLVVATLPMLGLNLMPRVVAEFIETRPDVLISLQTRSSARVNEWVASGQLDLGIGLAIGEPSGVRSEPLVEMELFCALPPGSALEAKSTIDVHDLAGQDIIVYDHLDQSQLWLAALLDENQIYARRRLQVFWSAIAMDLVMRGVGVSIVDRLTASRFPGGIAQLRPFRPKLTFKLNFIWPTRAPASLVAQAFASLTRSRLSEELAMLEER